MSEIVKELAEMEDWLSQESLDPPVRAELETLKARYEAAPGDAEIADEIGDRFYRFMEFGTAGMRGVMGAGPNRINIHTIRKISQGYAEHLLAKAAASAAGCPPKVAIAFDNRRHSDLFAFEAACVFVANGVETYLFKQISATPLLSYTARALGTDGGVVVTASHNNKIYNGYKIYDDHGCQCMPEEAELVAEKIDAVDMWTGVRTISEIPAFAGMTMGCAGMTGDVPARMEQAAVGEPLLHLIDTAMEDEYIEQVLGTSLTPGALADLHVVYTPLNGAGSRPVQRLLAKAGIGSLAVVSEQADPDPDFTTAPEPNPEKPEALKLGLDLCRRLQAEGHAPDLLIGTDPDADRLGAAVLHGGDYVRLTGNQVGVLIFDYVIACRERDVRMPARPVFITTIVSTPLTGEMADKHGVEMRKVLTGFKNIGDQMNRLESDGEESRYIFGFEESCGYLSGTYARDKDAQNAALMLLEAAGALKQSGKTLLDRVEELYAEYGYYLDGLDELVRPGEKGMIEIKEIMAKLRDPDTLSVFSAVVRCTADYHTGERTEYKLGGACKKYPIVDVPESDVIEFDLADGCRILARPSGTEPKLKIYYTGVGPDEAAAEKAIRRMKAEIAKGIS
ncbi:phosphoglucomutase [Clostridia bacterium]|nr:phosphoglucomutase [Clostridia bacterium]